MMNMILKQRLIDLVIEFQEVEYNYKLSNEKITMQEAYIEDIKNNADIIIKEKQTNYDSNSIELGKKINDKKSLEENQKGLFESVTDQINVESKDVKLKDIRSTLIEKKKEKDTMIKFLSENEDCPACEQHIDTEFKSQMISTKETEKKEIVDGLTKMEDELNKTKVRLNEISKVTNEIQDNSIQIASLNTSIQELEKYQVKLSEEIKDLEKSTIDNSLVLNNSIDTLFRSQRRPRPTHVSFNPAWMEDEKRRTDCIELIFHRHSKHIEGRF